MINDSNVNRLRDFARQHGVALATTVAILLLLAAFSTWQAVRAMRAEAEAERQKSLGEQGSQEAAEYAAKLQASEAQARANAKKANDALATAEESARQARESKRQAEVIAQELIDAKSREAAARIDAFLPDRKFSKEEIGYLEEQVRAAEANLSIWDDRFIAGTVTKVEPLEAKAGLCIAKGRLAWAKGDLLQCQKEYSDAVAAWKQRVTIVRSQYRLGTVDYVAVYAAETPEREAEISISKVRERATRSGIRLLPPVAPSDADDEAIADYTAAIRLEPKDAAAYVGRAAAYENKGEHDKAIADFTKGIRLDLKSDYAYCGRGRVYDEKGEHDKAIADYTEAIRLDPKNAYAYCGRGRVYETKGEHDKAVADYTEAIRLEPKDATEYVGRAAAYENKGEHDKAIADYTEAIRLDPKNAYAYCGRGRVYETKGEHDKAVADYTEAIRLEPKDATEYVGRAAAYENKGEHDKAVADYTEAIRLEPKDATAYVGRAAAYENKGEHDKAIADLNQALRLDPNDAAAYSAFAWLQATCSDGKYRDKKKAVENASKAFQLGGGKDWSIVDTLAAAYAESGDFEKAKQWEAKAIKLAAADKSASDKDKAEARSRLELYKQGKPYREEPKKKQ